MSTTQGAVAESNSLERGTNWWGAFVIGLAGTILVTGIAPFAVQVLGAASIPLFVVVTGAGVLLSLCLAELAAMMPDRAGGLPSYADQTFRPLGSMVARHAGGISGWAYWLGWFPVAPINMILAASYIVALFALPSFGKFTTPILGTEVGVLNIIISLVGLGLLAIPSFLGIRLGATFATILGVVSMVPLTLLVILPVFQPDKFDAAAVTSFALPAGTEASFGLYAAWIFIMCWSVLAMEAAACYIGECRNPARDARIAMTASGLYGFAIYVLTPVAFVGVLGGADTFDPLTVYTQFTQKLFGEGSLVQWIVGIPLIVALMLSVLNAIMGCARSLYQIAEDGLIPRWFGRLNRNRVPGNAMGFNVVCSAIVLFFGSPLQIYVFSNMGYLLACSLALVGYYLYRSRRPDLARPVRLPGFVQYVALAIGLLGLVIWAIGGYLAADYVVAQDQRWLFILGLAILAAYLPLYWWRQIRDPLPQADEAVATI